MGVERHPHCLLTDETLKDDRSWGTTLYLRIRPDPDFHLLKAARRHLITYLNRITHGLARGPSPDELRRKVERAAAQLLEIFLCPSEPARP
jgi:hypothetical protein